MNPVDKLMLDYDLPRDGDFILMDDNVSFLAGDPESLDESSNGSPDGYYEEFFDSFNKLMDKYPELAKLGSKQKRNKSHNKLSEFIVEKKAENVSEKSKVAVNNSTNNNSPSLTGGSNDSDLDADNYDNYDDSYETIRIDGTPSSLREYIIDI